MTTLPLPSDDELTASGRAALSGLPPLNIFRMAARTTLLPAFGELARAVLTGGEIDPKAREIAVLRVTHATGKGYAWTQHVALGRMLGLSEEDIARIGSDGPGTGMDAEATLLCRVADEITRDVRLSDEALAALIDRYGPRQATELVFCCSYFNMVARFALSARVPLEGSGS